MRNAATPHAASEARPARAQAPTKASAAARIGRDPETPLWLRKSFIVSSFSERPFSHIGETSGVQGLSGAAGPSQYNAESGAIGNRRTDRTGGSPMPARFMRSLTARLVRRRSAGWLGHRGVGANSGRHDQDRRLERLLRSIRRSGRQGVAGRRSAGGRGLRQGGGRPQGRDHFRRSSEQARHRRRDCAAMGGSRRASTRSSTSPIPASVSPSTRSCTRRIARCSRPRPRPRT